MLDFLARPFAECTDVDRLIDEQLARLRTRIKSLRALEHPLSALGGRYSAPQTAADGGILKKLVTAAHRTAINVGSAVANVVACKPCPVRNPKGVL